jgi:hypothetical protein
MISTFSGTICGKTWKTASMHGKRIHTPGAFEFIVLRAYHPAAVALFFAVSRRPTVKMEKRL